jgi:hypothetical protein
MLWSLDEAMERILVSRKREIILLFLWIKLCFGVVTKEKYGLVQFRCS